jgi:hypothetical protein
MAGRTAWLACAVTSALIAGCAGATPSPGGTAPTAAPSIATVASSPVATATRAATPSPAPSPSATTAPLGTTWGQIWLPSEHRSAQVADIVAASTGGLVAVGARYPEQLEDESEPAAESEAMAWTSADGITWDAHVLPGGDWAVSVVEGGPGLVAVGGGHGFVAWSSSDGVTWTPAQVSEWGEPHVRGLVAGPNGLLAFAYSIPPMCGPGCGGSTPGDAATLVSATIPHADDAVEMSVGGSEGGSMAWTLVWRSTDGLVWTGPDRLPGIGPLAATASAYLFGREGAVMTSPDGETWTRQDLPGYVSGQSVQQIAVGPDRVLAAGCKTIWSSADGETWQVAADAVDLEGADPGCPVQEIAWTQIGFVGIERQGGKAGLVVSADGAEWAPLGELFPLAAFYDGITHVVDGGDRLLLAGPSPVGSNWSDPRMAAYVRISPASLIQP